MRGDIHKKLKALDEAKQILELAQTPVLSSYFYILSSQKEYTAHGVNTIQHRCVILGVDVTSCPEGPPFFRDENLTNSG